MIEAVNAAISSAVLSRSTSNQTGQSGGVASVLADIAPQAPSLSVHVDLDYDKAVLQVLDGETGDVLTQFPSRETLAERQRTQAAKADLAREAVKIEKSPVAQDASKSSSAVSPLGGRVALDVSSLQAQSSSSPSLGAPSSVGAPEAQAAAAALSSAAASGVHSGQTVNVSA